MKPSPTRRGLALATFLILNLALVACQPVSEPAAGSPPADAPSDAAGDTAGDPSGDAATGAAPTDPSAADAGGEAAALELSQTFSDPALGIALDYPVGWRAESDGQLTANLFSYAADQAPQAGGVPEHLTKIDVLVLAGFALDLEARRDQVRAELPSLTEDAELTLTGGQKAYWLRGGGGMAGDTAVLLTIIGDQLYQLQAYGDPEPLRAIGATLRAAE